MKLDELKIGDVIISDNGEGMDVVIVKQIQSSKDALIGLGILIRDRVDIYTAYVLYDDDEDTGDGYTDAEQPKLLSYFDFPNTEIKRKIIELFFNSPQNQYNVF